MHMKLNVKVILLLQFMEEVYINEKEQFTTFELRSMFETMTALMYLCEQLGILTLDMPDSFAYEYSPVDSIRQTTQSDSLKPIDLVKRQAAIDSKGLNQINMYGMPISKQNEV